MRGLRRATLEVEPLSAVGARLRSGEVGLSLEGLVEGARALALALLQRDLDRPLLLVVPHDPALEAWRRDLAALAGLGGLDPRRVVTFPALDADPYAGIAAHPEIVRERVLALDRIARGDVGILLLPARALLAPLPAPEEWRAWSRVVRRGDTLPPNDFVLEALGLGYRRVDVVSAPGEVSRRGGVVDVFSPTADEPTRIELFGDTVESLRSFDTDHQRSTGPLEELTVVPALECPPTDAARGRLIAHLERGARRRAPDGPLPRDVRERVEVLQNRGYWPGAEALSKLAAARPVSLFEHAREMMVVVDEPPIAEGEVEGALRDLEASRAGVDDFTLGPPDELFCDPADVARRLSSAALYFHELAGDPYPGVRAAIEVACRTARSYAGRIAELVDDVRRARAAGTRTFFVMRAAGSAQRMREILGEYDLPSEALDEERATGVDPNHPGAVFVAVAALRAGFELPQAGLTVLSERDVFGEERKVADRKHAGRAAFVADFHDLRPGDLVVHVDHGVARYAGLGRPKGGSLNRDFMVLEFAGHDRLFVPVDRLDLVQKYSGVAGSKPPLDRLGGPGWARVKSKVRKSVESMARELLELYARRKAARGIAFSPDTPWQAELEAAFPFDLTPDQERSLREIKADMEGGRPTDRLLVGDVGYGKTEIAVRAAFKAVMDGRQVAVLAPTTVLAAQHFSTFRSRYAPFPVRVEMISRFRTAGEQRAVIEALAQGSVDVVIGTHRLLSKDVRFKNLGLLVVDEEQRFGVAHKERLKALSIGIEVLSMTATPIPRTLQMSLAGVRDLSVIETPPPGRMAIQTYIVPFRIQLLANAIRHELRRRGQVFFVNDKIESLPALARELAEAVPEARIVVAHGQMRERQLESVMLRFVRHEADVLLTTTIIENGLDIPRANTIVVNRADHFGLAQLYQLRGRVGRSHEHAYAYFVVVDREGLSSDARKRLRALQEFSELGAGFRLAAADLEIRGAGELLGSRQHGHIAALGFDLYCQMLERAVQEVRGEPVAERQPVALHLGIDIKIPETFLPDPGDRLVIYKRLAQAANGPEIDRLQAEIEDRYGHPPPPVKSLFDMGRLRLLAEAAGVKSVDVAEERLQIRFHDRPTVALERVLGIVSRERGSLTPSGALVLPAPRRSADRVRVVGEILRDLEGGGAAGGPA